MTAIKSPKHADSGPPPKTQHTLTTGGIELRSVLPFAGSNCDPSRRQCQGTLGSRQEALRPPSMSQSLAYLVAAQKLEEGGEIFPVR